MAAAPPGPCRVRLLTCGTGRPLRARTTTAHVGTNRKLCYNRLMASNESLDAAPQRRCPHCGNPVARRADTCLLCGARLQERARRKTDRPALGDLALPLVIVAAVVVLWLWKPWQAGQPKAAVVPTATATATVVPTPTFPVAPTATPLSSPTAPPTATPPPDQTVHTVKKGETVITIAKLYGTTQAAILKANKLKASSPIHVGDQLIIPLPAANTPTPTLTPLPSPTPFEYVVRTGDTLSEIARRYGTTVEAIMQANDIADATDLHAGVRLTIVGRPTGPTSVAYTMYVVQQGDTLSTIAAKFGLTVARLKQLNGLKSDRLVVGQKLKLTVGTATPLPTQTPLPTLTPTPAPPYPAPALLVPPDGALFEGADTVILLSWASVGILPKDDWYVLRLRRAGAITEQLPPVWTKVTSWRLPAELYMADPAGPQRLDWQVVVMHHSGTDAEGAWTGEELSPRSGTRTFYWK